MKLFKGISTCLGSLGVLVQVEEKTPEENKLEDEKEMKEENVVHVLIVDRSGSMGRDSPTKIIRLYGDLAVKHGSDPKTPTHVLVFGSTADRILVDGECPTLAQLRGLVVDGKGGTRLSPIFGMLADTLASIDPDTDVQVTVISDGEVGDIADCLQGRDALSARLSQLNRTGWIDVNMIRIFSDRADTKAMCHLSTALQNGAGAIGCSLHLINAAIGCSQFENAWIKELAKKMSDMMARNGNSTEKHRVKCKTPAIQPYEGAPVPTDSVDIKVVDGWAYVLLAPGSSAIALRVDGEPIDMKSTESFYWPLIQAFVQSRNAPVCSTILSGTALQPGQEEWYAAMLRQCIADIEADDATAPVRRASLRKVMRLVRKCICDQLRQICALRSQSSVLTLQKMSNVLTGSVSPALAKRIGDIDPVVLAQCILDAAKRVSAGAVNVDVDTTVCSLVTLETWGTMFTEVLPEAIRLLGQIAEVDLDAVVSTLLGTVGGIGVAIRLDDIKDSEDSSRVDPWRNPDMVGSIIYGSTVSQPDVVGKHVNVGGGKKANGVVPLRYLCPKLYDLWVTTGKPLHEALTSLMLRKNLLSVPYDYLATLASTAWLIMRQLGTDATGTEYARTILEDLLYQMQEILETYGRKSFEPLVYAMCPDGGGVRDPYAEWTGANGVTSILKLIAMLCADPRCKYLGKPESKEVARRMLMYVFDLDAYFKAAAHYGRDAEARLTALINLLGIGPEYYHPNPLAPFKPPVLDLPACIRRTDDLDWMPSQNGVVGLWRVMQACGHGPGYLSKHGPPPGPETLCTSDTFDLCVAANALFSRTTKERQDGVKKRGFEPWTPGAIQSMADRICSGAHAAAVRAMELEETKKMLEEKIEMLCQADVDQFVSTLSDTDINGRSLNGANKLEKALLDLDRPVQYRLEKLAILILGRRDGVVVWNGGNAYRGNLHQHSQVFDHIDPSGQSWQDVHKSLRSSTHRYRESNKPNRHGFSNLHPSWWAMGGFESLAHLVSEWGANSEEYAEYKRKKQEALDARSTWAH